MWAENAVAARRNETLSSVFDKSYCGEINFCLITDVIIQVAENTFSLDLPQYPTIHMYYRDLWHASPE